MPKSVSPKPAPKRDDPEESKLFEDSARELGPDENEEASQRALKATIPAKPAKKSSAKLSPSARSTP